MALKWRQEWISCSDFIETLYSTTPSNVPRWAFHCRELTLLNSDHSVCFRNLIPIWKLELLTWSVSVTVTLVSLRFHEESDSPPPVSLCLCVAESVMLVWRVSPPSGLARTATWRWQRTRGPFSLSSSRWFDWHNSGPVTRRCGSGSRCPPGSSTLWRFVFFLRLVDNLCGRAALLGRTTLPGKSTCYVINSIWMSQGLNCLRIYLNLQS